MRLKSRVMTPWSDKGETKMGACIRAIVWRELFVVKADPSRRVYNTNIGTREMRRNITRNKNGNANFPLAPLMNIRPAIPTSTLKSP